MLGEPETDVFIPELCNRFDQLDNIAAAVAVAERFEVGLLTLKCGHRSICDYEEHHLRARLRGSLRATASTTSGPLRNLLGNLRHLGDGHARGRHLRRLARPFRFAAIIRADSWR
jgi:hypothetical protein